MNHNDKRINAYKKVSAFTPPPLTAEEPRREKTTATKELRETPKNDTVKSDALQIALDRNGLLKIPNLSSAAGEKMRDSTYRRVAKFLLLIGVEEASKVLKHLSQEQIDKVIPEIASIRNVERDEAAVILAEFETLMRRSRESGGVETARTILEKAFGGEMAESMLQKSVPFPDGKPFEYLREMDGERLLYLLHDESAPVRALVLSYLKPSAAADAIKRFTPQEQTETVKRLAKMQTVSPDILRRIDRAMQEKVQQQQTKSGSSIDGRNALAEILRRMDTGTEQEILSHLSGSDPELEADLRARLFTIDDVITTDNRYLQNKLSSMQNEDIALLIAGKTPELRKKILSNISKGRGDVILEEESLRKPISRKDSERITADFITTLRAAWEAGEFALQDREDDIWVQ